MISGQKWLNAWDSVRYYRTHVQVACLLLEGKIPSLPVDRHGTLFWTKNVGESMVLGQRISYAVQIVKEHLGFGSLQRKLKLKNNWKVEELCLSVKGGWSPVKDPNTTFRRLTYRNKSCE